MFPVTSIVVAAHIDDLLRSPPRERLAKSAPRTSRGSTRSASALNERLVDPASGPADGRSTFRSSPTTRSGADLPAPRSLLPDERVRPPADAFGVSRARGAGRLAGRGPRAGRMSRSVSPSGSSGRHSASARTGSAAREDAAQAPLAVADEPPTTSLAARSGPRPAAARAARAGEDQPRPSTRQPRAGARTSNPRTSARRRRHVAARHEDDRLA